MEYTKLETEALRQKVLLEKIVQEGYTLVDDNHPLKDMVGSIQEFTVYVDVLTPNLLCKLFIKGMDSNPQSYYFIPLWQIIKFCGADIIHKQGVFPVAGAEFNLTCIVGPRRITNEKQWVPALRLPLR